MSEKDSDKESCSAPELLDFKDAVKEFQKLVEKLVTQKTKEKLGLYVKDDGKRYFLLMEKCNFHMERRYEARL